MSITPERLDELDAVMAKAITPWKLAEPVDGGIPTIYPDTGKMEFPIALRPDYIKVEVWLAHAAAIVALHNAYPDLRAHLDAQAATIAGMREALNEAQGWFAEYAVLHLDKNTPEGVAKAASNARKAEYCAAALNATGAA